MSERSAKLAATTAMVDQEESELIDWLRLLARESPGLLTAISDYLNASVDKTGTELTPDMLRTLKRLARVGWYRTIGKMIGVKP